MTTMSKAQFELIAAVFKDAMQRMSPEPGGDLDFMHEKLVVGMTAALAATNPAFDRIRFKRACGR